MVRAVSTLKHRRCNPVIYDAHGRNSFEIESVHIVEVPHSEFGIEEKADDCGDAILSIIEHWMGLAFPHWKSVSAEFAFYGDQLDCTDLKKALLFMTTSGQRGTRLFHMKSHVTDYALLQRTVLKVNPYCSYY